MSTTKVKLAVTPEEVRTKWNAVQHQRTNSTSTRQSKKAENRITRLITSATHNTLSILSDIFQEAIFVTGLQGIYSGGASFRIIHDSFFNQDRLRLRESLLEEIYRKYATEANLYSFYWNTDIGLMKASTCPKEMLLGKFSLTNSELIRSILVEKVAFPVLSEEVLFRGIVQELLLKQGMRKLITAVSPKHASLVDSKIYTACRIVLTSLLGVAILEGSHKFHADNYTELMFNPTFMLGIGWGISKEVKGLPGSMAAHAVHRTISLLMQGIAARC